VDPVAVGTEQQEIMVLVDLPVQLIPVEVGVVALVEILILVAMAAQVL
jgi:hypothetical protein